LVAGEPSGDRMAAGVARVLSRQGMTCFGMGGEACARAGVRVLVDGRRSAVMGVTDVVRRLPAVLGAYAKLARLARTERPLAAVLVDYAEFNERLGRHLRGLGIPVLRCVAPQVWAWRRKRLHARIRSFDRLAAILPFEEPLWRDAGLDAHYVGHPALDGEPRGRAEVRSRLGLEGHRVAIALLPGSRTHEVRRLAPSMLAALTEIERAGRSVEARLFVATSLDDGTRRWLEERASAAGVRCVDVSSDRGAGEWLAGFDASLAASGTATLESALAGAPPVIVYRVSAVTAAIARRLLRIPSIGLPNVLLGRAAYPELLQDDVTPHNIARALEGVLERRSDFESLARSLRRQLEPRPSNLETTSERIAALMHDWLGLEPEHATHASRPEVQLA
jgi:lipid-A-disaccharide synthase